MKKEKTFDCKFLEKFLPSFLNIIIYMLIFLILFLMGSILWVFVETSFRAEYAPQVSRAAILCMQSFWADYKGLIMVLGYSATLLVVTYNLRQYIASEKIKALSDLRAKLNEERKRNVHKYLMDPDDKKAIIKNSKVFRDITNDGIEFDSADLLDYLGIIELGAIMLRNHVITFSEFDNQFGYRVENIMANKDIMEHINKYKEYYKNLTYTIKKMYPKCKD